MTESFTALLRRSDKALETGIRAFELFRPAEARTAFLECAEALLAAAAMSDEPMRRRLITQAEAMLDQAEDCRLPGTEKRQAPPLKTESENQDAGSKAWTRVARTGVRFDDVIGLNEPKRLVYNLVVRPLLDPDGARRWGRSAGGGLLLYGPPGNGKTLFARALAGELDAVFLNVVGSAMLSKWVGEAEKNVTALFEEAAQYDRCIIFIDEVDALVPRRGSGSTVMDRVVPAFLSALDGVSGRQEGLLLLGATNRPDTLDSAALRRNRFEHLVYIGLPDLAARQALLDYCLRKLPVTPDLNLDQYAKTLSGHSGADITTVCEKATQFAWDREEDLGWRVLLEAQNLEKAIAATPPAARQ